MSNLHQDTSMMTSPPVVTLSVPVYQPPTVIQSDLSMKHTSCGMITVGVFLILFSSGSLGLSAYLFGSIGSADIVWAAMISGSFFFLMGILAIYGGSSVWKRKGTIIISAIIGCIGIAAALVACGLAAYATNQENINRTLCITCHANLVANNIDFENKWKTLNIVKGELNGVIKSDLDIQHTSCGMITVGVFLILLSSGSLGLSSYLTVRLGSPPLVLAAMISGSFFFIMGLLAIFGGSSVWMRKGVIIVTAVLGCIGIGAALVTFVFAVYTVAKEDEEKTLCKTCHTKLVADNIDPKNVGKIFNIVKGEHEGMCEIPCSLPPYVILGVLAILEGIFGFLLSVIACCNCCSFCCCYKRPPTDPNIVSYFPKFPAISNLVTFNRPSGDYAYNRLEE